MGELDKKYPGLLKAFQKLKERRRLNNDDIIPLQKFVDATVTCTTNVAELKKIFHPIQDEDYEEQEPCDGECDPVDCITCAGKCAELVRQMVLAVNTHHHTKTCRKKGPGCRFGILSILFCLEKGV